MLFLFVQVLKNVFELEKNIERMIENDDLRIKMAKQANADAQQYSWERAVMLFEKYVK